MSNHKKIQNHPSICFAEAVKTICSPLKKMDIVYFAHVHIDRNNQFAALGQEPKFVELYLRKHYYHYDIHQKPSELPDQYILWDDIERNKESKELYDDFQSFHLGHTFSIIQQDHTGRNCYHFASKLGDSKNNAVYLQNINALKNFILYFNDKISSQKELKNAYDIKFSLSENVGGYFTEDKQQKSLLSNHTLKRLAFYPKQYVSQREFECLHWLANGKTVEETAMILNITTRTVKAHIKNIKEKMNCTNQFQLGMLYQRLKSYGINELDNQVYLAT